jgi:hypothetical protein
MTLVLSITKGQGYTAGVAQALHRIAGKRGRRLRALHEVGAPTTWNQESSSCSGRRGCRRQAPRKGRPRWGGSKTLNTMWILGFVLGLLRTRHAKR